MPHQYLREARGLEEALCHRQLLVHQAALAWLQRVGLLAVPCEGRQQVGLLEVPFGSLLAHLWHQEEDLLVVHQVVLCGHPWELVAHPWVHRAEVYVLRGCVCVRRGCCEKGDAVFDGKTQWW